MEELNEFIEKTKGNTNISCVITTPKKVDKVIEELLSKNFLLVNNKVDFYTLSQEGRFFFVPVYKLENLEDWYKIAFDYASGQLYDYEMDKRVNPNYQGNNIIFVIYENDVNASAKNLLEIVGLTLQVK